MTTATKTSNPDLYVVERLVDPEAEVETGPPVDLYIAENIAARIAGGWDQDMVRPQLGEYRAWRGPAGRWLVIRRATPVEIEEAR